MNILFIGSNSVLSLNPFRALLESKHNVCAFGFDDDNNLNVLNAGSIQDLAFEHSIPFLKFNKDYSNVTSEIEKYQPDIILVSCYSRLLPKKILSLAKLGAFNVHPSLLPNFRGPIPLFWQFQMGVDNFGVTLHRISNEFDAGNIVSQKTLEVNDGLTQKEVNGALSYVAGDLLVEFLNLVENNTVTDRVQDTQLASYQSYPSKEDFEVSVSWTAKRIYNFISAYKGNSAEFLCQLNDGEVKLLDVLSFQEEPYDGMNNRGVVQVGNKIWLACQSGYLEGVIKVE